MLKKLTEVQIKNEIQDMYQDVKVPESILPGLDDFILEWNRQTIKLRKEDKKKLFSWVNED